jgi:alpha-D-xyloside xylohydrolase
MRPMFLEFPADDVCASDAVEQQQFMLGPDWLIAPVTQENATSWPVYLPSGTWSYWWNKTTVQSRGQWAVVNTASIADFPLFRREW